MNGRCVHDNQRSFALGIQWIKVRILGTIPAPMIFGTLIDNTCILWQESCDDAGACLVYDNLYMSKYVTPLSISHQSINNKSPGKNPLLKWPPEPSQSG